MYLCKMEQLNFPSFNFRVKNTENKTLVFDVLRKKFVVLTPEEWVRQHVILYFHQMLLYPLNHMISEKKTGHKNSNQRLDLLIMSAEGNPLILVECKAPQVAITQNTFDQIARYQRGVNAEFLMVTNGLNHYFCKMDYENESYQFLKALPAYNKEK